jgi:hypothetical protein
MGIGVWLLTLSLRLDKKVSIRYVQFKPVFTHVSSYCHVNSIKSLRI